MQTLTTNHPTNATIAAMIDLAQRHGIVGATECRTIGADGRCIHNGVQWVDFGHNVATGNHVQRTIYVQTVRDCLIALGY